MTNNHKALQSAGLKVTLPRVKILKILESKAEEHKHMSAEDVYKKLIENGDDVGIATVYRVLTQFEAANLVVRHNFEGGLSVFEVLQDEHHDHMICIDTGNIVEFVNAEIEELQKKIAEQYGYDLIDHRLVLYVRTKSL